MAAAAYERTGRPVRCVEIHPVLCAQLEAEQRFEAWQGDFNAYDGERGEDAVPMSADYDRVLMNPPFERGQDREHVQRAYRMLKPGGRLVAVMSEGPFVRQSNADKAFRQWLRAVGGRSRKLPADAFRAAGTGVQTRLVVIDRPRQLEIAGATRPDTTACQLQLVLEA